MTTNHHYKSFMRRSVVLSFIVGVFAGVSVSGSVSAASSTKVTWKISSLSAGEVKKLSAMASTNSPGVKTWSKSGTCTLTPKRKPTNLTMGATGSCDLILKIAKSKNYPARTSRKTITLITPAATVALERTYAVGETGPGGGIVFYDAGTAQPWGRYLEAAPTDYQVNGIRARVSWGCDGMPGGKTSTGIGTGLANTSTMLSRGLSKCTTSGIAAEVANRYRTCTDGRSSTSEDAVCPFTGLGQWFLPSKDELKLMYDNRVAIGGFSADYNYWSSSEDDENIAWAQSFSSGSQRYSEKYSNYYVRPVRAFFGTTPVEPITDLTKCPAIDGTAVRTTNFAKAPPMCIDSKKSYTATFNTSEGSIEISLHTTKTPKTVNNFVTLSRYKYYDGSLIFRTDPSIDIIQGGGKTNTDSPGYTIEDEGSGYKYSEGDIAMTGTSKPNSAGGQFFIVTGPKASVLDRQGTYVVFGKISKGLDVAKAIIGLNAGSGSLGGAPSRAVKITSVTITEK